MILVATESRATADRAGAELELARAAGAGEPEAQSRLVGQLVDRVRRASSYLCADPTLAEDLAQQALIEILASVHNFRGDCSLGYWADRIAVRTAIRGLKKRRRLNMLHTPLTEMIDGQVQVEKDYGDKEIRQRLAKQLDKIPLKRRVALVLHHVWDYQIDEIVEMTGARKNTVRARLRVARKELRRYVTHDPVLQEWSERRAR
jgi:RNA polymerase sigma-70 factor (ECF subfamily)